MCPVCIGTAVMLASGGASAGGVAAVVLRAVRGARGRGIRCKQKASGRLRVRAPSLSP